MAKLYSCDRCRQKIEATDEERRNWSVLTLSKLEGSATFQNADLCDLCTNNLRLFLQGSEVVTVPVPEPTKPYNRPAVEYNPEDEIPF